jgi:hypothetical protein
MADLFGDGSGIREFLSNEISHSDVRHLQQLCKPASVRAFTDARTSKKHPLHSTSLLSNRRRISQARSLLLLLYHLQAITPLGDSPMKSRDPQPTTSHHHRHNVVLLSVQRKQLLSLSQSSSNDDYDFSFFFSFSFGLLSRPKNGTTINYNTKTAAVLCFASHKRRRTPDRNNAQERENNASKEKKKGDRRGSKEGRKELGGFFFWLTVNSQKYF